MLRIPHAMERKINDTNYKTYVYLWDQLIYDRQQNGTWSMRIPEK